jgi:hypothetical protein
MVIVKGNFSAQQARKAQPADTAEGMMADLGLDNLVILSKGDRGATVAYFNDYEGRRYFHVRNVYMKQGEWKHGKGIAMDPAIAKEVCAHLGELAEKL